MRVDIEYLVFAMGPDDVRKTDAGKIEKPMLAFSLSQNILECMKSVVTNRKCYNHLSSIYIEIINMHNDRGQV